MSTNSQQNSPTTSAVHVDKVHMTAAMREGLEALQREYDAFRESSFQTLALISNCRIGSR